MEPGEAPSSPPELPRRRRQSHLAPQLANQPQPQRSQGGWPERSPDQVRDRYSAIESGTRRARTRQQDQGQDHQDGDGRRGGHR